MEKLRTSSVVLVFNSKNELAMQLRAAQDNSFPLHWDFSAGGKVDEGESEEECIKRELKEEIGVDAKPVFVAMEHCVYTRWNSQDTREVDVWIYKTRHDGPFEIDKEEVEEVKFFTLEEIAEMIKSSEKFQPEFVIAWEKGIVANAAR